MLGYREFLLGFESGGGRLRGGRSLASGERSSRRQGRGREKARKRHIMKQTERERERKMENGQGPLKRRVVTVHRRCS